MTISSENFRKQYSGNGSTTVFPYDFKITAASQLNVIATSSAGVETTLVLDTHYSVSGVGEQSGGNVTYPISGTALPTGSLITIRRILSLLQSLDLTNQTAFQAGSVEEVFDKIIMMLQQHEEILNRTITLPVSDSIIPVLPTNAQRISNYLGFDEVGQFAVLDTIPQSITDAQVAAVAAEAAAAYAIGSVIIIPAEVSDANIITNHKAYPCNGAAISRTTYADLFAVVGTIYGVGDGSTTFTMPNWNGEEVFLRGRGATPTLSADFGTKQGDAIRNITGQADGAMGLESYSGVLGGGNMSYNNTPSTGYQYHGLSFDASRVVPTASENRPVNYSVKYAIIYGSI